MKKLKSRIIQFVAFASTVLLANSARCQSLYWTFASPNGLQPVLMRSHLDGSNPQSLLQSPDGGPRPIALDVPDGFLYFGYSGTITRYDLNGNNPTTIFNTATNPSGISGIAVDPLHNSLYWTFNSPNGLQPVLMRSTLNGSNPQPLLQSGNGGERPIALDLTDGFLYAGFSGTITRYDLNGNNPTTIFNTATNPSVISGIAVDPLHNALYWTFNSPNGLQPVLMRSNLDGSNPQPLLQSANGGDRPIALDVPDGFLYSGFSGTITRYDLNGNNPLVVFNTATNPSGISGLAVLSVPEPSAFSLTAIAMIGFGVVCCRRNFDVEMRRQRSQM